MMDRFKEENQNKNNIMRERFNRVGNFEQFTEKVIKKYNSDKYRHRWYNRGIEPPEDLF